MITLVNVAKAHGAMPLFTDVGLQLVPGRRVALVGGNGAGKTTLLEIVVGLQQPDTGEVSRAKDTRVGYLPQEPPLVRDGTVLDEVLRGAAHVLELQDRLTELEHRIADARDPDEALLTEYGTLQHRFEQLGGFQIEAEAQRVMAGLGFAPDDGDRQLGELSGGWLMRVALAKLLLSRPDLLVLDEPTNHLDIESIEWLEQTLAAHEGAVLFVSHDRDFIDAVADRIVELSAGAATEYVVDGFGDFVAQREQRLEQLRAAAKQQEREIAATERFIERFRYKATKARQVQSRIKALDRIDRIEVPDDRQTSARFAFPPPRRSGRVVAELADVHLSFGERHVYQGLDLVVERGDKIAVVGPNGAGKSTLLKLLTGHLDADAGTVTIGHNVDRAYFAQHQVDALDLDKTVLAEFAGGLGEAHRGQNVRTMLGSFGFPGDAPDRTVRSCSGGERTRLALAKLMAHPVNLLCLDEPTNHLDIASRDLLEDALDAYPGTIVMVTHDRHVIRAVADRILEVRDGHARLFAGDWEDYLNRTIGPAAAAPDRPAPLPPREPDEKDRKRREADRRNALYRATKDLRAEVERIEAALEHTEAEVARLTRELAEPGVYDDNDRVKDLVAAHQDAKTRAADLMGRWEDAQLALERATEQVESEFAT